MININNKFLGRVNNYGKYTNNYDGSRSRKNGGNELFR